MSTCIRAVIVDDHLLFLEALRALLHSDDKVQVVGQATDAASAVRVVTECKPDLLLLDFALPPASGLDVLRDLAAANVVVPTLMITAAVGDSEMIQALELGARGVLLKQSAADMLLRAVHAIVAGQYWVERDRVGRVVQEMRRSSQEGPRDADGLPLRFTRRQLQIMTAIVSGGSNDDIARELSIRPTTVKYHLAQLFEKTGAANRVALARMVTSRGLNIPEDTRRRA